MSHTQIARPRLSIGLPVYNGARWIAVALDSLLSQSFRDFELIISDNCSTDETGSICEEYARRDDRIRYVQQSINRGLVWNWNHVFELSNSEYFKWSACDDVFAPGFLEQCIAVLDNDPGVVWCHSRTQHIDCRGELLLGEQTPAVSYVCADGSPDKICRTSDQASKRFQAILLGKDGCMDSYGVIRSSVLRRTGLYPAYYGSEKVLMAELALWGSYYEVPEVLCFARVHDNAAGSLRSARQQRFCINPFARRWQSDRLGLLRSYIAAVSRAELPRSEKARCYAVIGKYLLQTRKWTAVLRKMMTGAGLTGEYPSTAPAAANLET